MLTICTLIESLLLYQVGVDSFLLTTTTFKWLKTPNNRRVLLLDQKKSKYTLFLQCKLLVVARINMRFIFNLSIKLSPSFLHIVVWSLENYCIAVNTHYIGGLVGIEN